MVRLVLEDPRGRKLPRWSPGAHIDVVAGDFVRKYSLCGDPDDPYRLQVSILRETAGRGGSTFFHETIKGRFALIHIRGLKNHFRLDETADSYVLIAGGIGITPIIAMADRLKHLGKDYSIHYCGRARETMALLSRLESDHSSRLHLYPASENRRLSLSTVAGKDNATQIYACGPEHLLDALEEATSDYPETLHVEHFTATGAILDPAKEIGFDVILTDSELTVHVAPDQTGASGPAGGRC